MLGAIFGDIVGSAYEFNNTKDYDFQLLSQWSRPTDDSYMTLAVAKALIETLPPRELKLKFIDPEILAAKKLSRKVDEIRAGETCEAVVENMQEVGNRYPHAGYGGMFALWLRDKDPRPYGSYGNGSGMRVSAAGWLYDTLQETTEVAELTAKVTHDHPEGIKGAQAIAAAIFMARYRLTKTEIKTFITRQFGYDLDRTLDDIRPGYSFDVTCQGSVPEAIIAFLEGDSYEDVIRKAVSLGGDSDTIACMAGGIAEAYYGMPDKYKEEAMRRLDAPMRQIVYDFKKIVACRNQ